MKKTGKLLICLCTIMGLMSWNGTLRASDSPSPLAKSGESIFPCEHPGWFPANFGLKDHTFFHHDGYYYIASIYFTPEHWEDLFAYARSSDLCHWEELDPILTVRTPGAWDEFRIWAPFVLEEDGVLYMFYTGVTQDITQSIMLATTTDPADPASWTSQGMIFQPSHAGQVWEAGKWADCRDPVVLKVNTRYYLYYTGKDKDGGIVGLATASYPQGPWTDWGAVIRVPPDDPLPESSFIVAFQGWFYLFFRSQVRVGPTAAGPWSSPRTFRPGWAHEILYDGDRWLSSYLTDYSVSIGPLTWDTVFSPSWPFIGSEIYHLWLPLVTAQAN